MIIKIPTDFFKSIFNVMNRIKQTIVGIISENPIQ